LIALAAPQLRRIAGSANCSKGDRDVIRTVWFASFSLALLGGLFVAKVISAHVSQRPAGLNRTAAPEIALVSGNIE
jgi:hypothetical protein